MRGATQHKKDQSTPEPRAPHPDSLIAKLTAVVDALEAKTAAAATRPKPRPIPADVPRFELEVG